MTDICQPFTETAATIQPPPFRPWKPHRWTRKNTPHRFAWSWIGPERP